MYSILFICFYIVIYIFKYIFIITCLPFMIITCIMENFYLYILFFYSFIFSNPSSILLPLPTYKSLFSFFFNYLYFQICFPSLPLLCSYPSSHFSSGKLSLLPDACPPLSSLFTRWIFHTRETMKY